MLVLGVWLILKIAKGLEKKREYKNKGGLVLFDAEPTRTLAVVAIFVLHRPSTGTAAAFFPVIRRHAYVYAFALSFFEEIS